MILKKHRVNDGCKRVNYVIVLVALVLSHSSIGQIRLPKHVSDGMVIQRNERVKIWGWSGAREKVTIRFKGKKYSTESDEEGKWEAWILPSKAGGPYDLRITTSNDEATVRNILIGDVWFCSGQSNMQHNFGRHQDRYEREIAEADFPEIRQFLVSPNPKLTGPQEDVAEGSWKEASPENILEFSLIGYFFSKTLYDQYKVPIGFINSSVGGTPIRSWISENGLKEFPKLTEQINQNKDTAFVNEINRSAWSQRMNSNKKPNPDKGLSGELKWYEPTYQTSDWKSMVIPGYWEDQGIRDLNGTVWFRKEINIPQSMVGKPGRIHMGRIVDADQVYINGKQVGGITYQYPQRRYDFDSGILTNGKNVITIRVTNYGGKGGFVPDKPYYLAAGIDTINLIGTWKYQVGEVFSPRQEWSRPVRSINAQNEPTSLFNGMVAPFEDFPIKGAVWYQGESDVWRAKEYDQLLTALVNDWRDHWKKPQLPVLVAQLPNFLEVNYLPEESSWAELRNAQLKVLDLPNTALAVSLNLGEWNDIHPGNKKPIGERLALGARSIAYREDLVYSGPIYKSAVVEENKAILSFDHVGSGLTSSDGEELRWFAIAGMDKKFVWAETEMKGDQLVVWSEEVLNPAYVRYAWMDNPDRANFFNKEGLPASPFEAVLFDENALWKGKKAAVVLTYDDALEVQLDNVIPVLEENGFKGTFYLSGSFPGLQNRLEDWKRAAKSGHELGNHTLYHPCRADGRDWVTETNDLGKYTTDQLIKEVDMMNIFLKSLDGKEERTFAYTCGDTETGEGPFIDSIKDKFVAMRGVNGEVNNIETLNLSNLNAFIADGQNANQLIEWAEEAREKNAMMIILFHGVGGGHNGNVELEEHTKFIEYLKANEKDYWVTTMIDAAQHCIDQKQR